MLTKPFKNRCIGARVNLWKSKTCPVTPPFKIFLWLSHYQRWTKKSLWWLPKPYMVWPWTPILTTSTSFFPSHLVLLFFKLTKFISVSGPWYFSPPLPELLFLWICAWLPFLLPCGLYSNISFTDRGKIEMFIINLFLFFSDFKVSRLLAMICRLIYLWQFAFLSNHFSTNLFFFPLGLYCWEIYHAI